MNRISILASLLLLSSSPSISADSTVEAITTFGLLGTWSPDCTSQYFNRVTFSLASDNSINESTYSQKNSATTTLPIISAVRATENKIQIILGGKPLNREGVIEKVGNKIRVLSDRPVGDQLFGVFVSQGHTFLKSGDTTTDLGMDTREMEKCLN